MFYYTNNFEYSLGKKYKKTEKFFLPRLMSLLSSTDQDLHFDSGLGHSLRSDSQVMTKITILSYTWALLESRSNIKDFSNEPQIIPNDLRMAQSSLLNERNFWVNKNKGTKDLLLEREARSG